MELRNNRVRIKRSRPVKSIKKIFSLTLPPILSWLEQSCPLIQTRLKLTSLRLGTVLAWTLYHLRLNDLHQIQHLPVLEHGCARLPVLVKHPHVDARAGQGGVQVLQLGVQDLLLVRVEPQGTRTLSVLQNRWKHRHMHNSHWTTDWMWRVQFQLNRHFLTALCHIILTQVQLIQTVLVPVLFVILYDFIQTFSHDSPFLPSLLTKEFWHNK